jgi:hypothetical protein
MIGLVAAATIAGILAFVLDVQNVTGFLWEIPVILMGGAIAAGGSLALGIQRSRRPRLALASILACLAMWVLFILALFNVSVPGQPDRWYYQAITLLIVVAYTFGLWSCMALPVLSLEVNQRAPRLLRRTALILGTGLAAMWVGYYVLDQIFSIDEHAIRMALMLTSVAATGALLCLPPAVFLDRGMTSAVPMHVEALLCPRCGAPCDSSAADCKCPRCALPIRLDRGEPRCACGYLLVNLDGNTCPECGRRFATRIRYEMVSV